MEMLWANSGDSHFMEPPNMFDNVPQHLRDRLPRSEKSADGLVETIHVDGQSFRRDLPQRDPNAPRPNNLAMPSDLSQEQFLRQFAAGTTADGRLKDLDGEGVWGEVIYPSLGIWQSNIRTPEIAKIGARAINEWAIDFQRQSPRFVCAASVPLLDVQDAASEIAWAANQGFMCGFLSVAPPIGRPPWQSEEWDPMWAAFAENGTVIAFHIGTEPHNPTERTGVYHRGRGGAVLNYTETTYGGQRAVTQLIAAGVLDRHPDLKVLVSEGGATWGPFIADRMDEGYRQHGAAVRPTLSKPPSRFLYEQIYASFQHDRSAVAAATAMGWRNVMWGSDYPHFEGTFGHTQKTLHELFDDVNPADSHRIRIGAFQELFPSVPPPPPDAQRG
jgi:predicted TIM-barrel fold metal-dependent hydrolase